MADKDRIEKDLAELREQLEKLKTSEWLYINNQKGEKIYLTKNHSAIAEAIKDEIEFTIKHFEELQAN